MDLLLTITNEHVQQVAISDNNNRPWIDKEVIQMMQIECVKKRRKLVIIWILNILKKSEEMPQSLLK